MMNMGTVVDFEHECIIDLYMTSLLSLCYNLAQLLLTVLKRNISPQPTKHFSIKAPL